MKTPTFALLAVLGWNIAMADSALIGNPYLPYPPACAVIPSPYAIGGIENFAVKFHQETVDFYDSHSGTQIPVVIKGFRSPCSEAGRSLVWLEFSLLRQYGVQAIDLALPIPVVELDNGERVLMHLVAEPNGWRNSGWVERDRTILSNRPSLPASEPFRTEPQKKWVFLLDNAPHAHIHLGLRDLSPGEYNGAFTLLLRYPPNDFFSFEVPATAEVMVEKPPAMSLSGRLSGNWVIEGSADQGMVISVSERIQASVPGQPDRAEMPMVLFLAHYTFDAKGNMLWLTGAASFGPGTRSVTLPIERVTNGRFRASQAAKREVVGSVTITANNCNDLTFRYNYTGVGLGQGEKHLQRLFSLETAGLECRDYAARVATNR